MYSPAFWNKSYHKIHNKVKPLKWITGLLTHVKREAESIVGFKPPLMN